ncbi:non-specific lipid transfer GPI-anchored 1 [Olea europaea subsp. europaea]|uniref:Non-specific lipid transfer GPI-anchored 1 n=1 Tax=Olea europaea subsp. europaea TaxID=158383 RepID=A0A8S0SEN6_OLEEU|nr:non-specific lipid transfer GPI-anchored 1 [Olea europaea subsp. europaea]
MVKKMEAKCLATLIVFMAVCGGFTAGGADTALANKCSAEFQKVMACLTFATGKAAAPSKECCDSVSDLKETDPACLCFVIQQIHNGSNPAIKQMGVQESRLLQLPSACKLANASVSECPKLLHLPANSSDAAIFTNANATTTPPGTSSPTTAADSNGFRHGPQQLAGILAITITSIFFYAFPAGV